jgi:hypothetical protein
MTSRLFLILGCLLLTQAHVETSNAPQTSETSGYSGDRDLSRVYKTLKNEGAISIVGLAFILFGMALLWYNERRAIRQSKLLEKAKKLCVDSSAQPINLENDKELVCVKGRSKTQYIIVDPDFGVNITDSVKLRRKVEVYQLLESKTTSKSSTRYYYNLGWSDTHMNSGNFNKVERRNANNNVKFISTSQTLLANSVTLGEFNLNESQIERMKYFRTLKLPIETVSATQVQNKASELSWAPQITVVGDCLYYRQYPDNDTINDIRVTYDYVPCGPFTVIAKQMQNTFEPYNYKIQKFRHARSFSPDDAVVQNLVAEHSKDSTPDFLKEDEYVDYVFDSEFDKNQAFATKENQNILYSYCLRFAGGFLIFFAIVHPFQPVVEFFSAITLLGEVVRVGLMTVSGILSVAISFVIIGTSYIVHRPNLALCLLSVPVAVFLILLMRLMQ